MERGKELVDIGQIDKRYDVIILDAGPLMSYLPINGGDSVDDEEKFAEFFIDKISLHNCFLPKLVEEEYVNGRNENWIKNTKQGKLIMKFQNERRILCVEESHFGSRVKRGDAFLEKFGETYKIHPVDLRVVTGGIALSDFSNSSAIISNDIRGIGNFWNAILSTKKLTCKNLGLFIRRELDYYERCFNKYE